MKTPANPNVVDCQMRTQASPAAACSACRFWKHLSQTTGACRRHAPQVVTYVESKTIGESGEYREAVDSYTTSEFPQTLEDEWCGDYQPNSEVRHGGPDAPN